MTKTNVFDCANFLIQITQEQNMEINNTKLQKLLYYAQAYHLVKNKKQSLFLEPIEAWDYGPVIPDVYFKFRLFYGEKLKPAIDKSTNIPLSTSQQKSLRYVIEKYGHLNANEISKLTHQEDPWQDSFKNFDLSLNRITPEQLFNFFKDQFSD